MRRKQGFTTVELIVVVFVIILLTAFTLPNWRSGEQSLALDRAAHKAGQDVRRAQELSLRAQAHSCAVGEMKGYGVYFSQDKDSLTSYIIFAECSGNFEYDQGVDDIVETLFLESGIEIASVSPSPAVSILFIPPTPQVFIKPGDPLNAQVSFKRTDGAGAPKILDINSKGVIDID